MGNQTMAAVAAPGENTTRQRIIDAALRLIADRGYRGTTVGQIEEAAGLTPRAGGLYKHFGSKREVLAAAMQQRTEAIDQVVTTLRQAVRATPVEDLRSELQTIAHSMLREFENERTLLRIAMKEGDRFPELRREFYDRFPRRGYGEAQRWLVATCELHGRVPADPEGMTAIVFGGLVHYHLMQTVFDEPPPGVDEDRFVDAWVEATATLLRSWGVANFSDPKEATA
jgi:AcrR family transcriptional regulator